MIVICGQLRVRESKLAALLEAASRMAAATRSEAGCSKYRFGVDIDDPLVIQMFEHWVSTAALEAHFAMQHFAEFSELLIDASDGPAEFDRYEVSSVTPLFG
jgi:quinol monooxygenase YgiN